MAAVMLSMTRPSISRWLMPAESKGELTMMGPALRLGESNPCVTPHLVPQPQTVLISVALAMKE